MTGGSALVRSMHRRSTLVVRVCQTRRWREVVRNSWLCFIPGTPLPSSSVSSDTAAVMPERAAPVAGR